MNRFLVRAVPMAVALTLFANAANSQDDGPPPFLPCEDYDIYSGYGDFGPLHLPDSIGVISDAVEFTEATLDAVVDLICKIIPCGGTDGGGDDVPPEDPDPDDGGTDGGGDDAPSDNPGSDDGGGGENTNVEEASVLTCSSDDQRSFEEVVAGIRVVRQGFREGVFVTEFASDSATLPQFFTFNRPFRLPNEIKSANELSGDWFVPRGRYMVDAKNRVRIPVKKR